MQRPIRFKAFDKATGRVYPGPYFALFGETTCFDLVSQWLMEKPLGKTSLERMNDVQVFEGTGILDSGKREIFENDIVSETDGSLWVVSYSDGSFWFVNPFDKTNRCTYDWLVDNGFWGTQVVVGTAHENPELLK